MGNLDDNDIKSDGNKELNAETRRIPKELIEKQIRMEAEKAREKTNSTDENKNKTIDKRIIQSKSNDIDSSKTMMMNAGDIRKEELKTDSEIKNQNFGEKSQAMSLNTTIPIKKEDLSNRLTNDEQKDFKDTDFNKNMKLPKPPQEKTNITYWLLAGILIVLLLIFLIFKSNNQEINTDNKNTNPISIKSETVNENEIKDENDDSNIEVVDEAPIGEESEDTVIEKKPKLLNKIKIINTIKISNDDLFGKSLMKIRKKGAIFSEKIDPKIVAISEALKKRVGIINSLKTVKRGNILSKIWRGRIFGFKIDAIQRKKASEIIIDRIRIMTPSKAQYSIIKGVLYSVKRLKYESLIKDLEKYGISIIENFDENNKVLTVNLNKTSSKNVPIKQKFLLSSNGIFNIKAGDGVENINLNIPKGFGVIKKTIEIDEFTSYNIYKIHDQKFRTMFFIKGWKGRIEKIEIPNSRIKTKEGISVGSTVGMLRAYFENIEVAKTGSNLIVIPFKEIGGYFVLDLSIEDFDSENIEDSVKIIEIVLE